MSMWWSNQSVSLAMAVIAGMRAVQCGALSLVRPAALRRARSGLMRVITMVAGH